MNFKKVLIAALCGSLHLGSLAQTATVSPYSRYGLGEIQFPGSVKQFGMGRTGVAIADPDRINFLNPAAMSEQRVTLLESGIKADVSKHETGSESQTTNGASISYFSLGFPIVRETVGASLGIKPYSSTGYEVNDVSEAAGCDCGRIRSTFDGNGDVNSYFLGAGYAPFSRRIARFHASALYDSLKQVNDTLGIRRYERKANALAGLSIGFYGSWLFGTLNQTRSVDFIDSTSFLDTRVQNSISLGDLHFRFGILYQRDLENDGFVSLGISGSPSADIRSKRNSLWYTFRSNDFFTDIRDTVEHIVDQKGSVTIPLAVSGGIAFGKKNKWVISADYASQQWSNYESFGTTDSLKNSTTASAGFEIIPRYGSARLLENIWYRVGGYYNSSYLQLNGVRINDFGIAIGLGIPVLKADHSRNLSPLYQQKAVLQFAVEAGQYGTREKGLLRQRYLRFHLGIVFKELWFIKRKYD